MSKVIALAVIALLLAAPLALRETPPPPGAPRRLVILTPHGEPTRLEFARAFTAWAQRERGWQVDVDWRTPGGTSEITRYLDERYKAGIAQAHPDWDSKAILRALDPKTDSAERTAFLASDIGTGADLLFGGGEQPFRRHATTGYLVDAGLQNTEPSWFSPEVIPQQLSGETVYDPKGRYYGACLAVFGIAASPDRLAELGLPIPRQWADLATPAYRGRLTLADPSKSGAVVTAMERIIQQAMAAEGPAAGWVTGLNRIKILVANSRSITDSASKPTRDAARGDAVAAMAIDFQARAEAEWSASEAQGPARLVFTAPAGGTSVSADPIGLLRGATDRELAVAFLHFVLSPAGQRLWNYRVGTPGGPVRYALRRIPVRADVLTPADRALMSDPEIDPQALAKEFTYRPEWTRALAPLIGPLVKAIALDVRDELTEAWTAVCAAGGPGIDSPAWRRFAEIPVSYADAPAAVAALNAGPETSLPVQRRWSESARAAYRTVGAPVAWPASEVPAAPHQPTAGIWLEHHRAGLEAGAPGTDVRRTESLVRKNAMNLEHQLTQVINPGAPASRPASEVPAAPQQLTAGIWLEHRRAGLEAGAPGTGAGRTGLLVRTESTP